jgi:Ca-activated chloride channel family protein
LRSILLALLISAFVNAQQPYREDVQVTLVSIYVTALDSSGQVQSGLTDDDFVLTEDGIPQTISSFSSGNEDVPLSVGFLVDNSGSMTKSDLEMARSAGLILLNEMKTDDKMFLVAFRQDQSSLVEPTFDKKKIESTLTSMQPRYGNTAIYDAIYFAAKKLNQELGRKVLILFSDGQDNSSKRSFKDLMMDVGGLSDVTILSIGTLFHQSDAHRFMAEQDYRKGHEVMEKLADVTGGASVFPESVKEMQQSLGDFRSLIRNQYTLGYYPTNRAQDHKWREISITCKRKGVRLTYRKGYVAPGPESIELPQGSSTYETNGSTTHR